jgi:hypothetical protein
MVLNLPNITVLHNEYAEKQAAVKLPGVMILGKNRNSIKSELETSELAFRVRFLTAEADMSEISELILISNEDYAEALKYALIAETHGIPHVLITTAINGKFSVRLLHIIYTDESSEVSAVGAVVKANERIKDRIFSSREGYYIRAFGEGTHRIEELFANLLDRLPNFDFAELDITLHCHPTDTIFDDNERLPVIIEKLLDPERLFVPTLERINNGADPDVIIADAFGF